MNRSNLRCRIPKTRALFVLFVSMYLILQVALIQQHKLNPTTSDSQQFLSPLPSMDANFAQQSTKDDSFEIDLQKEIQKGLDYANSIKDTKRKLVFVHIPKTAGTTIEEVGGLQAKMAWGSCLFNHRPKRRGGVCKYPPGQFEWPTKIGYWHLPPQIFPILGVNPYENADLFAVIREPHDRLLSEFYYICRRKRTNWWDAIDCDQTRVHDPAYMNEWMRGKIEELSEENPTPKGYLAYNGHLTPQYDFLVSRQSQIRMVDYVLHMDNLDTEFSALMKAYGIPAEMLPHKKNAARDDPNDLGPQHLDSTVLELVNQKYGVDAELFP